MSGKKKSLGIAAVTGFVLSLLFLMLSGLFTSSETSAELVSASVFCISLAVIFGISFLATKAQSSS